MHTTKSRGEIYRIISPEMLLIGQHKGEIIVIDTHKNYNKQRGRYAACRIRPQLLAHRISFGGRLGWPHLKMDVDALGNAVADISTAGLWRVMTSLAARRKDGELILPRDLRWLFDPNSADYCSARDWCEYVLPALAFGGKRPVEPEHYLAVDCELADPNTRALWQEWAAIAKRQPSIKFFNSSNFSP